MHPLLQIANGSPRLYFDPSTGLQLLDARSLGTCLVQGSGSETRRNETTTVNFDPNMLNAIRMRAPRTSRLLGLNIEFEHGFGGKLRWLIRLQTGI